jgi:hypothetical protein
MKRSILLIALGLWAIAPNLAQAQWSVGPHILVSFPNSDFANVSKTGAGFGIKAAHRLRSLGGVGLRGDFAFLSYGREITTVTDPFFGTFIAEVRNDAIRLTFGPEYTFGTRKFKAHVGVLGGLYFFKTDINIDQFTPISSESDAALGWNFGGGLMFDVGLGPWIDLGVEYQSIYNVPAPVPDPANPGEVLSSDITAHEITLKIGILFFLR